MDNNNFYSTDRLIEFGMSMSIAQQMVGSMNKIMAETVVPNSRLPPPQKAAAERVSYAVFEGNQAGPFSETEIARLIGDKKIIRETLVWHPGLAEWKTAENVPEILRLVALTPPALGA
jgi:hypothetical protein